MKIIMPLFIATLLLIAPLARGENGITIGPSPAAESACRSFGVSSKTFTLGRTRAKVVFTERCEVLGVAVHYTLTVENLSTHTVRVAMTSVPPVTLINYRPVLKTLAPKESTRYAFLSSSVIIRHGGRFDFDMSDDHAHTMHASLSGFEIIQPKTPSSRRLAGTMLAQN